MTAAPVFAGAALFDGYGNPVGDVSLPPLDGPDGLMRSRPVCRILFDLNDEAAWERADVDLIFVLPLGLGPHPIPDDTLAAMVGVMDQGGRIALHASSDEAAEWAISAAVALTGGWRA